MAALQSVTQRTWPPLSVFRILTSVEEKSDSTELSGHGHEEAEHITARAADLLQKSALRVETVIRYGGPGSTIVEEAEEWDADWIVVGANDESSTLKKWLLGSVVQSVVKHAPCSVEVIRQKVRLQPLEDAQAQKDRSLSEGTPNLEFA